MSKMRATYIGPGRQADTLHRQLLDILWEMYTNPRIKCGIDIKSIDRASESASLTTAATLESDDTFLSNLLDMSHRKYDINDIPDELVHETPSNYMDISYLQEYIKNLDEQLDPNWDEDAEEVLKDPNRVKRPPPSRIVASDKDLILRNSDSVISWLRRNHPETFIQDKDNDKEKAEPKKRGGGKRASVAAPKKEPEEVEEDIETLPELPPAEKPIKGKKSKEAPRLLRGNGATTGSQNLPAEEGREQKRLLDECLIIIMKQKCLHQIICTI